MVQSIQPNIWIQRDAWEGSTRVLHYIVRLKGNAQGSVSLDSNSSSASYKQRHPVFSKAQLLLRNGDDKIHTDKKKNPEMSLKAGRQEEKRG